MTQRDFPPIHPGEVLVEDFLKPMSLTQSTVAEAIGISPRSVEEIAQGEQSITADVALRLGRFFEMEAQFWMNLQTRYDLEIAREQMSDTLNNEVRIFSKLQA